MALAEPIRIGFVLHSMGVAGAEVLVAEILERGAGALAPTIFCLDEIGELGRELQSRGVEAISLGRRPGLDLRLAGVIARAARDRDLELLHAHQYTPFFYSALARLRRAGRFKLILTEHGRHYPDRVSARRRWSNRWLLDRQADAITGCSEFSRRGLAEVDGFSAARIELIPNGVEVARYRTGDRAELRRRLGLDPDRTLVACVARFHPVKDHRTLLGAFAQVAAERADVDLLLAGDGPLRGRLEALSRELGLDSRVTFLGVRDDIPELLQAVDIFCMTSLSEAASLTLLEAMAAGLPIVATAVGGNPELVRDRRDGLLVPRGDAAAVARAILDLASNRDQAARMGASGRRRVEASFTLEDTVDAYLELYRRVAGEEADRVKLKLALAACSLLVALLAGELALRLLGYYGVRGAQVEKLRLVDDPVVDYRRIPGTSWITNNLRYDINSQGWRDGEHALEKPAGTFRILSVGDSVTNGHGVSVGDIYAKRLEELLNAGPAAAAGVERHEVILMSLGALNTAQEVHLLEVEGLRYSPDLVIVGYVLNDPSEGASLRRDRERVRQRGWIAAIKEEAKRSSVVHLGYRTAQRAAWALRRARGRAEVAAYATDDFFGRLHRDPKSWARVTRAFDRLQRISAEAGIPVLVVILPVLHDFESYRWADLHAQVEAAARARGFRTLDLLSAFRGRDPNDLQVVEGDHVHPNALGHQLAAEAIDRFLRDELWARPGG